MGWFDEQIKQRKQSDNDMFQESFLNMADAILGSRTASAFGSDETKADDAIHTILKYYGVKPQDMTVIS